MASEQPPADRSRLRKTFLRLGFLDTPKESERRQHIRYACSFPVTLRIGAGGQERIVRATARDVSIGGMLIEGGDVPDGTIRVHVQFEIPPDVLKDEQIPRQVQTTAAVRFRDKQHQTISLAFSEPLRASPMRRISGDRWILLVYLLLLALLTPVAFYVQALTKYVVVWTIGFLVTLLLTPVVRVAAIKLGVVDHPDERRAHRTPTPRGGGLAVVIGFYCAAVVALKYPWEWSMGSLNPTWLHSFLIASGVLVLVGIIDDVRGLRPTVKLLGQGVAASLMFSTGHGMGRLLGFDLPLPVDFVVTLVWFVALTNAFNLIDGLDGLATGLALVAGIGLMGAFFIRRMPSDALLMMGLAGACMAFLRYNFHPASIFLGDTGSMFLGFTFASIAVATGSKGTFLASLGVPLLAVGIPVFDTILAIWRRSMRALVSEPESPGRRSGLMQPDAEHLHHRLRRQGLNQYQIAVLLYVINALLVVTGLLSLAFRDQALGIFLVAFVAGAYVVMRHLVEVELWDTSRALIQGLRRPQQRVAAFLFYPIFDVVCLILTLGMSFGVLQLLQPTEHVWEHWIRSMPLWVAPVFLLFCASRVYSRVWSLARTHDYLILSAGLLASVLISTGVSSLLQPEQWRRFVVLAFVFSGLSHVLLVGSRMFVRGLVDGLALWSESQYYRRGGVVRRVLLYGSGSRCLLFLRERTLNTFGSSFRRMIVGLIDDDSNLRFRRVGGYVVLGSGPELPDLIRKYRIDEIVITAQLRDEALAALATLCKREDIHLSEWHYEERAVDVAEAARAVSPPAMPDPPPAAT
jgi:UDP-GlcNAc:undecaprenyl-phosphate GlcNAc-1-phosphate transferase